MPANSINRERLKTGLLGNNFDLKKSASVIRPTSGYYFIEYAIEFLFKDVFIFKIII